MEASDPIAKVRRVRRQQKLVKWVAKPNTLFKTGMQRATGH